MAPRTLTFSTSLTPDPALRQDARYTFDSADRQSIDTQIRATQTFLSVDVLNSRLGTYVSFVGADGAVGDVVCSGGGLNGKPTVQLATASNLLLSGTMFGILAEACVEGNKAHVVHGGILGPEVTGLAAGDEGWVRVTNNRCEKVAVLADEDVCVGWVDSGGFLRVGSQPIASVTGAAPTTAKYLIGAASVPAELTQAIAAEGLTSTFLFASATVAPIEARRTSGTTAADVDVGYLEALSTGTTAAEFGPAWRFYAKKGSGGSETLGTISLAWTNVTPSSEASKFVVKTRSAGGAAATAIEISETEVKATALAGVGTRFVTVTAAGVFGSSAAVGADANAKYLEDTTTAVNTNGVPIRALTGTLGFAKTSAQLATFTVTAAAGSVYEAIGVGHVVSASGAGTTGDGVSIAARLVDATPSARQVGRIRWEWVSPVALTPRADCVISVLSTDGEHDWLRVTDQGALRLPAYSTAARRPIFAGTDGTITATAIQFGEVQTALAAASSSIGVNSQKIAGLAAGAAPGEAAEYSQIGTAVNAAVSGTTNTLAKFTGTNVVGDSSITDASGTVNTTSVVTVTKAGIGTTKTAGLYSINTTASGSQVSAQIGGSAKHSGGTQHNFGWQCEPQTAGRAIWRLCYGTGDPVSSPPASTGSYVDTSDSSYGLSMWCNAFVSTGGTGFRCSAGGGGVKENGGTGQINFYGASTSIGTLLESALAVGDSDPCWDFYASAGTRTAGNFAQIRDGGGTVFAVSSATATRGRVSINGIPIGWTIVTTNVNATVAIGDRVHVQGGGITITLPAVPSVVSTRDHDIIIMEVNGAALGSPITINAAAGDLINGASSATINVPNGAMTLCHDGDGTNWRIVSSHLL